MSRSTESRSAPVRGLRLGLFSALLLAAAATRGHAQSGAARRFDPCIDALEPYWMKLELIDSAPEVPRDGWVWRAELASPRAGLSIVGRTPNLRAVSVRVETASGNVVAGELALSVAGGDNVIAWRPSAALAPRAAHTVTVKLDNTQVSGCRSAPVLEQSLTVTTTDALTTPPPEPPLREIALGRAWLSSALTCCVPVDKARCADPSSCFKCWQLSGVPLIVLRYDEVTPNASDDRLEHDLFYGASTRGRALRGWSSVRPAGVIQPLMYPDIDFSSVVREVCVTAATRNFRTGQISARTRCRSLSSFEDAAVLERELAGLLPSNLSFSAPSDPDLELGAPGCSASAPPILQTDTLQVAASYHSERLDCGTACIAMSGGVAGAAVGGGAPIMTAGSSAPRWVPPEPARHSGSGSGSGCSAAPERVQAAPARLGLAGLLLVALWRVRERKRCG